MIDPTKWGEPVLVHSVPSGALEDFMVVERYDGGYWAYFTTGPALTDQRLYRARGSSPLGPFTDPVPVLESLNVHTRLSRGRINIDLAIVDGIYQGLPKVGLFLYRFVSTGPRSCVESRSILIPPHGEFSVAAVNPSVAPDGGGYTIFFEGRGELQPNVSSAAAWKVYQAYWDGKAGLANVFPQSFVGANPHIVNFGHLWFLYTSQWNGHGFDTWARTQEVQQ